MNKSQSVLTHKAPNRFYLFSTFKSSEIINVCLRNQHDDIFRLNELRKRLSSQDSYLTLTRRSKV